MEQEEIWKDIKDYEGLYQVSNLGRVKSLKFGKEKLLKQTLNNYLVVGLFNNKDKKTKKIHRLLAEAWIPNPENKPQVNHIDGCKTNNDLSNLEWVTSSENILHAFRIKLKQPLCGKDNYSFGKYGKDSHSSKNVYQYSLDNIFIKKWDSVIEAKKELNIVHISACARGVRNKAGGYIWKYIKD